MNKEETFYNKYQITSVETGEPAEGKFFCLRLDTKKEDEIEAVREAVLSYAHTKAWFGNKKFANSLIEGAKEAGLFAKNEVIELFTEQEWKGKNHPGEKVPLKFKLVHPNAKLPTYAHEGDAGMDVYAVEDVLLPLGKCILVLTGLKAEIPDGYELQVRPRSGLSLKGVTVHNAPGTIDSKYRGEIGVPLIYSGDVSELRLSSDVANPESHLWAPKYKISRGDRIAQLVLAPITVADISETKELSETVRGEGGFGSTGK